MSQTSKKNPTKNDIVGQLILLLKEFEGLSAETDLRTRVQTLIPIYENFRSLGPSLMPEGLRSSARNRLLHYFLEYPFNILPGAELEIVSGISEWARRIRELRVEYGWKIVSGVTAKEMSLEEDTEISGLDFESMQPDDYILLNKEQDKQAAFRWNTAKEIRSSRGLSVRDKILEFLRQNVGVEVLGEELRYVSGDKTEWARRTRELRTEYGWPIVTKMSGRPGMNVGSYLLEQDRQSPPHDRRIPDPVRRAVLRRDKYRCRRCNWTHNDFNRSDPRHLELHHVKKHSTGGENTEANLITLCTVCHDEWHSKEAGDGEAGFGEWITSQV